MQVPLQVRNRDAAEPVVNNRVKDVEEIECPISPGNVEGGAARG